MGKKYHIHVFRYPGVYTDVSYFTTWILDTITGAEQEEQDSRYPTRYSFNRSRTGDILTRHRYNRSRTGEIQPGIDTIIVEQEISNQVYRYNRSRTGDIQPGKDSMNVL